MLLRLPLIELLQQVRSMRRYHCVSASTSAALGPVALTTDASEASAAAAPCVPFADEIGALLELYALSL